MPRQNRVLPTGEIIAHPARGLLTGNRGILHDAAGQLGTARWRHPHWISCALTYKDWRRQVMSPGTWTELFFLDEAVALSAGHRPCALCRRDAFTAFTTAWTRATGITPSARTIDQSLHATRVTRDRQQIRHRADCASLPDGTFVLHGAGPHLVSGPHLFPWTPSTYTAPVPRPETPITVLTPSPAVAALAAGYRPLLHPSALS